MNTVNFIGNVGLEPTIKTLDNGNVVATFDFCTSRKYKNTQGVEVEEKQWHRMVAWNKNAKKVQELLKKGTFASIKSQATNRSYDKEVIIQVSPKKSVTYIEKKFVTEYRIYDLMTM